MHDVAGLGGDDAVDVEVGAGENKALNDLPVAAGSRDSVVVAREGSIRFDANGDKLLELVRGRRYDGAPGSTDLRTIEFQRYQVVIAPSAHELRDNKTAKSQPTLLWLLVLQAAALAGNVAAEVEYAIALYNGTGTPKNEVAEIGRAHV